MKPTIERKPHRLMINEKSLTYGIVCNLTAPLRPDDALGSVCGGVTT